MPERPLRHLIISREFPPASYAPGGIGTYAAHIAGLLADAGETVHVIGERWAGAPEPREERCGGRLVVHRVALAGNSEALPLGAAASEAQRFAWQAAIQAESLIESEKIDVVEAQEWEAPLYYYLLRRAHGLGPRHRPPCVVHLHSPTEFIYRYNEWTGRPEYLPSARREEFCIRAADAWFCPSRYLARQVAERYAIPLESISVMPYPQGDAALVPRAAAVWQEQRVLYVGRLEPRKGLIEFVEAAVDVARGNPALSVDFVGDDVRYHRMVTVRRYLESRIPQTLRRRFRFHGVQSRPELSKHMAAARLAVVPSRWDNFPNTCIEAMSSGLPVLVSPTGGMTEMVEDGVTGWIAPSQSPADLGEALRRALATAPDQGQAMGRAAAESIRGLCGNEITTRRHLAKRREVARLPARTDSGAANRTAPLPGTPGVLRHGLAIVVEAEAGAASTVALDSIDRLITPPRALTVIERRDAASAEVLSRAIRALLEDHAVAAVALVPASVALEPRFVDVCDGVMAHNPRLGILSGWSDAGPAGFAEPGPAFPYQWITDGVGDTAVVRAEAFLQAGGLREHLPLSYARWDLWNAVMLAGWEALPYPGVLARRAPAPHARRRLEPDAALLRALRERFAGAFALDAEAVRALELLSTADSAPPIREILRLPLREQLGLVLEAVRQPRRALGWLRDSWPRVSR
jgi:glycogen synthase